MTQIKSIKSAKRVTLKSAGRGMTPAVQNGHEATAASALNIIHKRPVAGSPSAEALAAGLGPTPAHNLRFRGGRTIPRLTYVNLYVGGTSAWAASDIQKIDRALG